MKLLVLCTGNSCRSQMAEGFFRSQLRESDTVASAGLDPQGLNPNAVKVMDEAGIDISRQPSNHINEYVDGQFDFVITVCDNAAANCPVFPGGGQKMHWPFDDPAHATGTEEEVLNQFRRVRDGIEAKIKKWLEELREA